MNDAQEGPGAERRAGKRQRAAFMMRFRIAGEEGAAERMATTTDVSSVGVAFECPRPFQIGTDLVVAFVMPAEKSPVTAEGRITRIQEVERDRRYRHGLAFEKISEEDRQKLEKHVRNVDIDAILRGATEMNASDVHLLADRPPMVRVGGELSPLDLPPVPASDLEAMLKCMMTQEQRESFEKEMDVDFSHVLEGGTRFRVNVHYEMGRIAAALRVIQTKIRGVQELGLPRVVEELASRKKGLIIVTGPAGSGKSTTLAAIIDIINRQRKCMIISIEDPIEYVHTSDVGVVKQREVGVDTVSFASALRHVLRQDPNVILIGEMRDLESISMAITAAETGHLVLTTLHTPNTVECINRIIDVYPASQQAQIRSQLAECLQGVLGQLLLPLVDGSGLIVATEVLIATPAIRNLIRQGLPEQITSYIESGANLGMHSMDTCLAQLVKSGSVAPETARGYSRNPTKFG